MSKIRPGKFVFEVGTSRFAPIRWWQERGIFDDEEEAIDAALDLVKKIGHGTYDNSPFPPIRVRHGLWQVWEAFPARRDLFRGQSGANNGARGWVKYREAVRKRQPAMPGTRLDPTIPTEDLPPRIRASEHGIARKGKTGVKRKYFVTDPPGHAPIPPGRVPHTPRRQEYVR